MTEHKRFEADKSEFARENPVSYAGASSFDTFSNTLTALAQGLHVRHITTYELITCKPSDDVNIMFAQNPTIDQLPLSKDGHIVGVFERNGKGPSGESARQLRPLDDSILVAAELPLGDFLPLMANPPFYRLVLDGARISGIVTRSDLLKLPVRVLAFALCTSLETTMKDVIDFQLPHELDWLKYISLGRQEKIRARQAEFKKEQMDLPLLDLTEYYDKSTILLRHNNLGKAFEMDLKAIEKVRNAIAHGRSYAHDESSLVKFILTLERTQYWISYLNETYLNEAPTP